MTKEPLELVEGRPMTLTEEARRRAAILRRFDPPGNYDAGLLERQAQTIEGLRADLSANKHQEGGLMDAPLTTKDYPDGFNRLAVDIANVYGVHLDGCAAYGEIEHERHPTYTTPGCTCGFAKVAAKAEGRHLTEGECWCGPEVVHVEEDEPKPRKFMKITPGRITIIEPDGTVIETGVVPIVDPEYPEEGNSNA